MQPQNPVGVFVYLWKLHDFHVLGFLTTFVLMNRKDEYQLVSFILKFKGFQARVPRDLCRGWRSLCSPRGPFARARDSASFSSCSSSLASSLF